MSRRSLKERRQPDSPIHPKLASQPKLVWEAKTGSIIPKNAFLLNDLWIAKFHINVVVPNNPQLKTFVGPLDPQCGLLRIEVDKKNVSHGGNEIQILANPEFDTTWTQITRKFDPVQYRAIPANPGCPISPNFFIAKVTCKESVGIGTIYRSVEGKWMVSYAISEEEFGECELSTENRPSSVVFTVLAFK